MNRGLEELIARMPGQIGAFEGSQYALPITQALYGRIPDLSWLREQAVAQDAADPPLIALSLAEIIEASMADRGGYFISDATYRGHVFGVKRSPGWVFLLGEGQRSLAAGLRERRFLIFSTSPDAEETHFLGDRDTSLVYYVQSLIRYGMIHYRIPPGETHELSHLLEEDGPGIVVVNGEVSEVTATLTSAMMGLGAPALIPRSFPNPHGAWIYAEDEEEILTHCLEFRNLKVKTYRGAQVSLPEYCNPAYATQEIRPARTRRLSFFAVKRDMRVRDGTRVIGRPGEDLGVLVELGDRRADPVVASYIEDQAVRLLDHIDGVRVSRDGGLMIHFREGVEVTPEQIAEVLGRGVKYLFPSLQNVRATVILNGERLRELKPRVEKYLVARSKAICEVTEETMDAFYACTDCQTLSNAHCCVVTPERPPMCGKDWARIKANALLNPESDLYKRRGRRDKPFLGIMHRGFEGCAPDGRTWDLLANEACGKQISGITGVGTKYLTSPKFLEGDGGFRRVVWMTERTYRTVADGLPEGARIATEQDVSNMEELKRFLGDRHS